MGRNWRHRVVRLRSEIAVVGVEIRRPSGVSDLGGTGTESANILRTRSHIQLSGWLRKMVRVTPLVRLRAPQSA